MSGELQPAGYGEVLARLTAEVRAARIEAQRTANVSLLTLYWTIGSEILHQQQARGWGAKVIDQLARDLRAEFPNQRGFNRSNLYYMRAFAAAWPERAIVPTALGQLPWSHVRCLLDKLDDQDERDWYAAEAAEHGWTLSVLEHQIATGLRSRIAAAPSNFAGQLPDGDDAQLAQQLTRDPYVFDFLDPDRRHARSGNRYQPQARRLVDRRQTWNESKPYGTIIWSIKRRADPQADRQLCKGYLSDISDELRPSVKMDHGHIIWGF